VKYTYAYKTSDGVRHEASMEAGCRDAVFAALRAQGIKAIKVVAADGAKANGEIRGVRKRIVALAVSVSVSVTIVGTVLSVKTIHSGSDPREQGSKAADVTSLVAATPLPRQMVPGDRQRIIFTSQTVLTNRVESLLVRFAEPGRPFSVPNAEDRPGKAELDFAFKTPIYVSADEFTESIDLKRIVVGLKHELRDYVNAGGTVDDYIQALVKRQEAEIAYREKAERRLTEQVALIQDTAATPQGQEASADAVRKSAYEYWLRANAQLQSMGIFPLPLPNRLANYQLSIDLDE